MKRAEHVTNRIYVGRLSPSVAVPELEGLFSVHGPVAKIEIVIDHQNGQSEGFALVEMEIASDAVAAIKALDGTKLRGRTILVKPARVG